MAIETAVVEGVWPISGDKTVTYTSSGFGTPQLAILFMDYASSTENPRGFGRHTVGFISASADMAMGFRVSTSVTTTDSDSGITNTRAMGMVANGTWYQRANGWLTTDGCAIAYLAYGLTEARVRVLLIKGLANAAVFEKKLTGTSTDVTNPGFQPDALLCMTTGDSLTGFNTGSQEACWNFGVAHNNSSDEVSQWCILFEDKGGVSTSATATAIYEDKCIGISEGSSVTWIASVGGFDSSGFTITANNASAIDYVMFVAMKADNADDFDVGIIDSPTSTGETSLYATANDPIALLLGMVMNSSVDTLLTSGSEVGGMSFGLSDGTSGYAGGVYAEDGQSTTNSSSYNSSSGAVYLYQGDGTLEHDGDVSSLETGGFKLDLDTTDGTARKWGYFAIGPGSSAVTVSPLINSGLVNSGLVNKGLAG